MQLWQIQKKIHVSWLIAIVSVGVVVGTALVPLMGQTLFGSIAWLFVALMLFGICVWRCRVYVIPLCIIAGLLLGFWRASTLQTQLVAYKQLIGHNVQIKGMVVDDPDNGQHGEVLLRLGGIMFDKTPLQGKIWISATGSNDIKRGDIVEVEGRLGPGFGSFAGTMFQAKMVAAWRPQPGDVARQARDWFADKIRLGIHEPEASLGLGYLLGQRRALPTELTQALVITGLTHVVVASGYNLTILVRLARRLFVKVSKYLATLSSTIMIAGFMAVTGLSPSMSRAGLVAGLSLAAWYYGRRFHPLVLLPFAAAVTVLIDPSYAWSDLGWQLSFAAFAGVMILAPLLQRYFFGDKEPNIVRQILGETISASIMTFPIIVLAFGQFSNIAILTNLLILPFVPLAMFLVFITGIGSVIAPGVAAFIGLPAQWLLMYMTSTIHYFAAIPWAQTILTIQPWHVAIMYMVITIFCIYLWRATKYDLKDANLVE